MNTNASKPSRPVAAVPQLARKESLRWLEVSFTDTGFSALRAYRVQASIATGRPVSLAKALDALIKSHPFVADSQVSQ